MAVWVVRVLDGKDPAPVSESRFDDVGGWHARFVERMAELGVTVGCGDGTGFCPDRNVSRAQMAVFLSQAYKLPDGPDPCFSDVPSDAWYAASVAKLATSQITAGCGDGTAFCPDRDTTRAEMATFLHRALAAGYHHTCALKPDHTATCWGSNGDGRATAPAGTFTAITAGGDYTCALKTDRTATCWGNNRIGQTTVPRDAITTATTTGGTSLQEQRSERPSDHDDAEPRFAGETVLSTVENTVAAGSVAAADDDEAVLAAGYAITGGADASLFEIGAETGALAFVAVPDYERPADADGDNAYELVVEASSDTGDLLLTVTVTDDDTEAPAAPTATPTADTVTISWAPPDNTGPAITACEVQYRAAGDTDWTDWPHTGTDTAATITGLAPATSHELRVRAINPEGASEWSPAAITITAPATDPEPPTGPSEGQDQ